MRNNYFTTLLKGTTLFVAMLLSTAASFAGGDSGYYWFYSQISAYPTGKGTVYADTSSVAPQAADYAETVDVKYVQQGSSYGTAYVYAKPADDYLFAGWYTTSASGTDSLLSTLPATSLSLTTSTSSESYDELVDDYYSITPEETINAVFAKVIARLASGHEYMGTVSIDNIANDNGDAVTLTAVDTLENTTFDYWLDSKGTKYTDNPLSVTVNGTETYTAYFSNPNALTLDFGEGKLIAFSSSYSAYLPTAITGYKATNTTTGFYDENGNYIDYDEYEAAWGYYDYNEETGESTFVTYSGTIPEREASWQFSSFGYNYTQGTGAVFYAVGTQTILLYNDEYAYEYDTNYLVGTLDDAVDIASLATTDENGNTLTFYVLEGDKFVKSTSGTVEAGSAYLALPSDQYPAYEEITAGDITPVKSIMTSAPTQKTGTYDLSGRKVSNPTHGLYIINGKKCVIK